MKALTLYQPWATLMAIEAKRNETKPWPTKYRGPLAIHAGMNTTYVNMKKDTYICGEHPFYDVLMDAAGPMSKRLNMNNFHGLLPLGCIVAICDLVRCVKLINVATYNYPKVGVNTWTIDDAGKVRYLEVGAQEKAFGDYRPGRWIWILENIKMADDPIPFKGVKGAMGLWEWADGDGRLDEFHGGFNAKS